MSEVLIIRRGGGSSGYTVTLTSLIPSGIETVTYTGTASGTVSIVNGTGSVLLQSGTYTFTSADTCWTSGTVAITGNISINCWYGTPVYWYGNICDSGSWARLNSNVVLSFGTDYVSVRSGTTGTARHAYTNNTYDLSAYNSINACCEYTGSSLTYTTYISYGTKASSASTTRIQTQTQTVAQTKEVISISLNQHPANAYLYFGNSAGSINSYLYAMWLN